MTVFFFLGQKVLLHRHQLMILKVFFLQICANTNHFALCNFTFQNASVVAHRKPFFLFVLAGFKAKSMFFGVFGRQKVLLHRHQLVIPKTFFANLC